MNASSSAILEAPAAVAPEPALLATRDLTVSYGDKEALHPTSLSFRKGEVTAFIGPSGCGKSTLLRCLNLMNREVVGCTMGGQILYRGRDILASDVNVYELRTSIGMVFQQPTPFRLSIAANVAFGPRHHGLAASREPELVERALRRAALWDEVKDDLKKSALALSGGQQQRLCIARALAMEPEVLLLDEPCSALDPISTFAIEETIRDIAASGVCVIIVTHNMEQARRISDRCAFFYLGTLVESGPTLELFNAPRTRRLSDYLTGRFG